MRRLLRILACTLAAPVLIGTAYAQSVAIVTLPAGSFSNSAGVAIAKVVTEKSEARAVVLAQASTGFEEVDTGAADFNVSNSFDCTFYATGTGEYEGRGAKPTLRHIATLIPYRVAMHVRADSDIKTMADLKGKRVSSGFNAQKTIARIIEAHLANAGLSYKDVVQVPTPNVVKEAEDFKAGKVDVMFFALGSAAVKEAAAAVGGVRVLEVNTAPDAIARSQKLLPGAYTLRLEPSKTIEGVTKPTNLIAFDMVMVSNDKVSDDAVYKVVKAIHDNKKELVATFPPFGLFAPEQMAKALADVPFHPGAVKYYKEIGLLK